MSRPYWNYLDAEATMLEWTGYLNRVLLIRLGRYSSRLLRPVARD